MFGLIGTAISGLLSGIFGATQQSKQIQEQKKENELAFERSKELASISNQYNIDQWNRENEYNLPINQIQRLKQAGLSPALMYKNGTSGLTSVSSPNLVSGSPYQPVDMTLGGNRVNFMDAFNTAVNSANTIANANYIRTKTEGEEITNFYLGSLSEAELQQRLKNLKLSDKQIEQFDYIFKEYQLNFDKLQAELDTLVLNQNLSKQENIRAWVQMHRDKINDAFQNVKIQSEVDLNRQALKLSKEQLNQIKEMFPEQMEQLKLANTKTKVEKLSIVQNMFLNMAQTLKIISDKDKTDFEAFLLSVESQYYKDHPNARKFEKIIDGAERVMGVLGSLGNMYNNALSAMGQMMPF